MELGHPFPKRRELIDKLSARPSIHTEPIKFQGIRHDLPREKVTLGFPRYRLENGRTTSQQAQHLAEHPDLSEYFFRKDSESDEAQAIQHKILIDLAKDKNLFKYFRKHKREQPLILSENGIVVNGNRRLAVWRALYDDSSEVFKHFARIEVVFLPPCDPADLD